MPGRPNIQSVTLNDPGDKLVVTGQTDGDRLPVDIRIVIVQGRHAAHGGLNASEQKMIADWSIEMLANGVTKGDAANGVGVEVRDPFEATSWTQSVTIE